MMNKRPRSDQHVLWHGDITQVVPEHIDPPVRRQQIRGDLAHRQMCQRSLSTSNVDTNIGW